METNPLLLNGCISLSAVINELIYQNFKPSDYPDSDFHQQLIVLSHLIPIFLIISAGSMLAYQDAEYYNYILPAAALARVGQTIHRALKDLPDV